MRCARCARHLVGGITALPASRHDARFRSAAATGAATRAFVAPLIGALVALQGKSDPSASSLWTSVLMAVFEPLLLRLRSSMRRPEDEDRDQRVLLAFTHALSRGWVQRSGNHAPLAIDRATRQALAPLGRCSCRSAITIPFPEERLGRRGVRGAAALFPEDGGWVGGRTTGDVAESSASSQASEARSTRAPERSGTIHTNPSLTPTTDTWAQSVVRPCAIATGTRASLLGEKLARSRRRRPGGCDARRGRSEAAQASPKPTL